MTYETATPYIASYILVRNPKGHVAFVLRSNTDWMNGYWGLPSGKVEKGEAFSAAAAREAKEEIGITVIPSQLKHVLTVHRHSDDSDWVDVYFTASNWEGELYNAEPNIHSELAWLDPSNLPLNVIPSVKDALAQIAAGSVFSEFGWDGQTEGSELSS